MNINQSTRSLEREIDEIKKKLVALEPLHPGNVSRQYQVCGNPNCRCMHPTQPQRHGPFHKLSYVFKGKPVCRFVRAECAEEMMRRVAVYKDFRTLIERWILLSIQVGMIEFFTPAKKRKSSPVKTRRKAL